MNKYKVSIFDIVSEDYFIDADSKSEAMEIALSMFLDDDVYFKRIDITVDKYEDEETE